MTTWSYDDTVKRDGVRELVWCLVGLRDMPRFLQD